MFCKYFRLDLVFPTGIASRPLKLRQFRPRKLNFKLISAAANHYVVMYSFNFRFPPRGGRPGEPLEGGARLPSHLAVFSGRKAQSFRHPLDPERSFHQHQQQPRDPQGQHPGRGEVHVQCGERSGKGGREGDRTGRAVRTDSYPGSEDERGRRGRVGVHKVQRDREPQPGDDRVGKRRQAGFPTIRRHSPAESRVGGELRDVHLPGGQHNQPQLAPDPEEREDRQRFDRAADPAQARQGEDHARQAHRDGGLGGDPDVHRDAPGLARPPVQVVPHRERRPAHDSGDRQ